MFVLRGRYAVWAIFVVFVGKLGASVTEEEVVEDWEADEPEGCPRNREEAKARGQECLRKCDYDSRCISQRKRCLCDGLCGWSCVRPDIVCEELSQPEKGLLKVKGESFGAVASYSCAEGYWLSGHKERVCQGNAKWSGTVPKCKERISTMCGSPPVVRHASNSAPLDKEQFKVDEIVQYSCLPGYDSNSSTGKFNKAKCHAWNTTARWFGPDLECSPRSCGPPGEIQNGRLEGTRFTYTSRVTYRCDPGYELQGKPQLYCQSNGKWNSSLPSCYAVQCEVPTDPLNGRVEYSSLSFNSVIEYSCHFRYRLVGERNRTCGSDKQWRGEEPQCGEIDCGPPAPFYNGYVEGLTYIMGSVVIFRCYEGMKLEGTIISATCLANGNWSSPAPKCLSPCIVPEVACGNVSEYSAGSRVSHGQEITVICKEHYELAFNATPTTCNNGTWNHIPVCIPARCRQLPDSPRNGMVIGPKTDHGMKALFRCKDGYDLHGINVTECQFGTWKTPTPVCKENYCPFPGILKNGRVLLVGYMGMYDYRPYVKKVTNNRQIMYECKRRYTLAEGPPGATCVDGQWSPKQLPKCVKESHPVLMTGGGQRRRRDIAMLRKRRKLTGRRRRRKGAKNDSRNSREPCSPFKETAWMQVEIVRLGRGNESLPHGTVVNITCTAGYRLNIGNRTAKCVKGRWRPKAPECETLPCDVPSTLNGVYHHFQRTVSRDDSVPHGEVLSLTCLPGYQLMGPDSLRCWYGNWAVDNLPECVPRPCELPVVPQGYYLSGYRSGLTISHGSSVEFDCKPDYVKVTEEKPIRCNEGELRPQPPTCVHHTMKRLNIVESPDGVLETDIRYRPQEVYGSSSVELSLGVGWRSCGPPERQENILTYPTGRVQSTQKDTPNTATTTQASTPKTFPHGTEVRFNCITGLMGEKATWKIVCEDGNWVGGAYKCEAEPDPSLTENRENKSCEFLNTEPNLVAFLGDREVIEEVSEYPPQTELVFRCKDIGKFSLIGSVRRRCVMGDWDGVTPSCFGLSQENDYALEGPPTILFRHQLGPIAQSNDGKLVVYPGTILHLECLWIRKYGIPHWQVSHSFRKYAEGWTNEAGRDPQLEYRLSIYHAQKDDSGRYTCITPMGHRHSVDIVVAAIHCTPIPQGPGLHISNPSTKMGTKVVFSCRDGQTIVGSDQTSCLSSGNWSTDPPTCQVTECPDLANETSTLEFLKVEISGRTVGSRATFSCPTGHGLRGSDLLLCTDSGRWSAAVPTCEEVICEAPGVPDNGYLQGGHRDVYRGGDVLQFACNSNHMMDGTAIIVCQESGRWSAAVPKCVQACQYPGTNPGATILSNVQFFYRINETITFDCMDGYELRGVKMLRCLENGRWSSTTPVCHSVRKG